MGKSGGGRVRVMRGLTVVLVALSQAIEDAGGRMARRRTWREGKSEVCSF